MNGLEAVTSSPVLTCIDPITDPLWLRLVERQESSVFHSPDWLRVLQDTYGLQVHAYVLVDGADEPCAGIPFCRIVDLHGKRLSSLPFSDYCDPVVHNVHQWQLLVDKLLAERCPVFLRCLHNDIPLSDTRFIVTKQAMWHVTDLRFDVDNLWNQIHPSARRATKKAERDGVVVKVAESEDTLRAFFEMYLRLRKQKYGLIAQPYVFFQNIWRQFVEKEKGKLLVAYYDGELIGGIFFLQWKDSFCYKFNASVPAYLSHRPNNLLLWEGVKYARAAGFQYLDFGLSDLDQDGLLRYKRQFATAEKTISFLQYRPVEALNPQEQQMRTLLPELTTLFTNEQVPDSITEKAGEALYHFFA
jgi:CelD/BcsL family acetyltransferase involved in cellulose biosynthesis